MAFFTRHLPLQLVLVGAGGAIGSLCRYALAEWLGGVDQGVLPWGTLTANLVGSLLLGMVIGYVDRNALESRLRLFLAVGLLGGFTTFSLFSYENLELLRDARVLATLANVSVQTGTGIGAAALGYLVSTARR